MLRSVKRDSKVSVCKVVVVLLSTYGPSALKTLRALASDRNRGALWLKSSFGSATFGPPSWRTGVPLVGH